MVMCKNGLCYWFPVAQVTRVYLSLTLTSSRATEDAPGLENVFVHIPEGSRWQVRLLVLDLQFLSFLKYLQLQKKNVNKCLRFFSFH